MFISAHPHRAAAWSSAAVFSRVTPTMMCESDRTRRTITSLDGQTRTRARKINARTADSETERGSSSHCQNLHIRRVEAAIKAEPRRGSDRLLIQVNPTPESNPLHHAYLIAYVVISNPNLLQSLGSGAPRLVAAAAERKNWRRNRKHACLCTAFTQRRSTFNGPRWQPDKAPQIKEQEGAGADASVDGGLAMKGTNWIMELIEIFTNGKKR